MDRNRRKGTAIAIVILVALLLTVQAGYLLWFAFVVSALFFGIGGLVALPAGVWTGFGMGVIFLAFAFYLLRRLRIPVAFTPLAVVLVVYGVWIVYISISGGGTVASLLEGDMAGLELASGIVLIAAGLLGCAGIVLFV
jgi:hypothetical protein